MIRLEEKELEKYILEEDCHIAMPFELHRKGGENEIITYSFTEKTAEEFEKRYCENPFSDEAKKFLLDELTPIMEKIGYDARVRLTGFTTNFAVQKPTHQRYSRTARL